MQAEGMSAIKDKIIDIQVFLKGHLFDRKFYPTGPLIWKYTCVQILKDFEDLNGLRLRLMLSLKLNKIDCDAFFQAKFT